MPPRSPGAPHRPSSPRTASLAHSLPGSPAVPEALAPRALSSPVCGDSPLMSGTPASVCLPAAISGVNPESTMHTLDRQATEPPGTPLPPRVPGKPPPEMRQASAILSCPPTPAPAAETPTVLSLQVAPQGVAANPLNPQTARPSTPASPASASQVGSPGSAASGVNFSSVAKKVRGARRQILVDSEQGKEKDKADKISGVIAGAHMRKSLGGRSGADAFAAAVEDMNLQATTQRLGAQIDDLSNTERRLSDRLEAAQESAAKAMKRLQELLAQEFSEEDARRAAELVTPVLQAEEEKRSVLQHLMRAKDDRYNTLLRKEGTVSNHFKLKITRLEAELQAADMEKDRLRSELEAGYKTTVVQVADAPKSRAGGGGAEGEPGEEGAETGDGSGAGDVSTPGSKSGAHIQTQVAKKRLEHQVAGLMKDKMKSKMMQRRLELALSQLKGRVRDVAEDMRAIGLDFIKAFQIDRGTFWQGAHDLGNRLALQLAKENEEAAKERDKASATAPSSLASPKSKPMISPSSAPQSDLTERGASPEQRAVSAMQTASQVTSGIAKLRQTFSSELWQNVKLPELDENSELREIVQAFVTAIQAVETELFRARRALAGKQGTAGKLFAALGGPSSPPEPALEAAPERPPPKPHAYSSKGTQTDVPPADGSGGAGDFTDLRTPSAPGAVTGTPSAAARMPSSGGVSAPASSTAPPQAQAPTAPSPAAPPSAQQQEPPPRPPTADQGVQVTLLLPRTEEPEPQARADEESSHIDNPERPYAKPWAASAGAAGGAGGPRQESRPGSPSSRRPSPQVRMPMTEFRPVSPFGERDTRPWRAPPSAPAIPADSARPAQIPNSSRRTTPAGKVFKVFCWHCGAGRFRDVGRCPECRVQLWYGVRAGQDKKRAMEDDARRSWSSRAREKQARRSSQVAVPIGVPASMVLTAAQPHNWPFPQAAGVSASDDSADGQDCPTILVDMFRGSRGSTAQRSPRAAATAPAAALERIEIPLDGTAAHPPLSARPPAESPRGATAARRRRRTEPSPRPAFDFTFSHDVLGQQPSPKCSGWGLPPGKPPPPLRPARPHPTACSVPVHPPVPSRRRNGARRRPSPPADPDDPTLTSFDEFVTRVVAAQREQRPAQERPRPRVAPREDSRAGAAPQDLAAIANSVAEDFARHRRAEAELKDMDRLREELEALRGAGFGEGTLPPVTAEVRRGRIPNAL
eukprot:TRINITY_DN18004_c0_g2_i1.p1 TRINITY_DN18004_c0_g2~~TRINITY_DN18004_c0_g2_i1.p1  ORF type:complete len:1209 (+),score=245.28 TRINITY_DN18004_c0_g2_i1:94-3720(+)